MRLTYLYAPQPHLAAITGFPKARLIERNDHRLEAPIEDPPFHEGLSVLRPDAPGA